MTQDRPLSRALVLGLAGALVMGGAGAASAAQIVQDRQVVDKPADYTPQILDGEVDSIAQVGDTMIVAGQFGQVQEVGSSVAVTRNNIVAFNRSTGRLSTTFLPIVDGPVRAVVAAPDGRSVYLGGAFGSVNGVRTLKVAKLDVTTGQKVAGFTPPTVNAVVRDLKLEGNRLFLAGEFTVPRTLLAELDPATGALRPFAATFTGTAFPSTLATASYRPTQAAPMIYKMDLTRDASKLAVVGNFAQVNGQDRNQLALFGLAGTSAATLSGFRTSRFKDSRCYNAFSYIPRDVEFSPDGTYFVVGTTGGYGQPGGPGTGSMCDSVSRWNASASSGAEVPTWVAYSGGDSTYTVGVTGAAVYTGGHTRWFNNPFGNDSPGPGAVAREGIAALDPTNGLPLSFNPGRARGQGVFAFLATPDGLWVGSDTARIGGGIHSRVALLPLADPGTKPVPQPSVAPLPVDVYRAGAPAPASQPGNVLFRVNAGGPALPATDGGPAWLADNGSSTLRNAGSTPASWNAISALMPDVPPSTPWALYSSERWDANDGNDLQWHFPVTAGRHVLVRVYLANQCTCTSAVGQRVFSATVDGTAVFSDLDMVAAFGDRVGGVRTLALTSDGSVDLTFLHGVQNPLVNGIEILDADAPAPSTATQDILSSGRYAGSATDPATTPAPAAASGNAWSTTRGAFVAGGTLYTAESHGGLSAHPVSGTTYGPARPLELHGLGAFAVDTQAMTGLFYDNGRIFYTLAGDPNLYSRYFSTEDEIVGAERFVVANSSGGTDWAKVAGMFLASNTVFTVNGTTGQLNRTPWTPGSPTAATGGSPAGPATPAPGADGVNWRARALFAVPAAAATPPVTPAAVCDTPTCAFLGTDSPDSRMQPHRPVLRRR